MLKGTVIRVPPGQGYGIVEPSEVCGLRDVVIFLKDQRAINERGWINPENKRTTIPEIGTKVKFLLDRKSEITPVAFLWAQIPKENIVKEMVPSAPENTTPKKEPILDVPQIAPQVSSNIQSDIKKKTPEPFCNTEQRPKQGKPIFVWPKPEKVRDDYGRPNNGPKRKVDGKRKVRKEKSRREKRYPENGLDFRYLARDVGATPIPGKVLPKRVTKTLGAPKQSQAVQNDSAQIKKSDSVPILPKARQESGRGIALKPWVAEEGVKAIFNGQHVKIGIVGG